MKVTFPRMGLINVPLKAFFHKLGVEVVEPPPITQKTISLGTRYAPEFACLPLKINVGNYLEAFELGADTIIMAGGVGPCRFGYYARVQQEILQDLGINYKMVVLEPPRGHLWGAMRQLWELTGKSSPVRIWQAGCLAWEKLKLLDQVESLSFKTRCREKIPGETDRVSRKIIGWVDAAHELASVQALGEKVKAEFAAIQINDEKIPLRVGLVGEIYTILEPAVNANIERFLGEQGVEVTRSIYLSEWVISHLFLDALHLRKDQQVLQEIAKPYLGHFVGGHGLESVGYTIKYAQQGFSGVVHIGPLTCMPEIVAKTILPVVSRDWRIPVISFLLDEHTGEVGLQTRIEAFVEMLMVRGEQEKHAISARH